MAELFPHGADISTRFQQVSSIGMPQGMAGNMLFDISPLRGLPDRAINI